MPHVRRPRTSNAARLPLNSLGGESPHYRPVTLPKLTFTAGEIDTSDAAERIMEMRTIRAGRDAYEQISKSESFENWRAIGAALAIGKQHALRVTGANAAWGQNYSREFSRWMQEHHFGSMPKATRSWAILLAEHGTEIEKWRATLPERERRRLVNPQSVVRRWQRTQQTAEFHQSPLAIAHSAWRRFVTSASSLSAEQATVLWDAIAAEMRQMRRA